MKRASLFGLVLWLGLARAGAQAGPAVRVSGCAGVSESELARLLAIELAELGDAGRAADIRVMCVKERVEIQARTYPGAPPRVQTLEVGADERDALARLLSLRIAELLATPEPLPKPPPALVSSPVPAPRVTKTDPHRQALTAAFVLRRLGPDALRSYGGRLGHERTIGPLLLASDLSMLGGEHDTSLAGVNERDLSLGVSLAYARSRPALDLRIGPGVRAGYVFLSADQVDLAYRARRYAAAWFGPFAALSLTVHGRSPWQGLLGAEVGYVTVPVRSKAEDGARLSRFDGPWLTLSLGARYAF